MKMPLVAPYTGAWIEIVAQHSPCYTYLVAPYTGAWIEIPDCNNVFKAALVAPYTGAWIEIFYSFWSLTTF